MLLLPLDCSTLPLILTLKCWVLSREESSTIFWIFGMIRPGIEPPFPGPLANTSGRSRLWSPTLLNPVTKIILTAYFFWGCKIHRLHLCRGVTLHQRMSWNYSKQFDSEAPVMLELREMRSTPLVPGSSWPRVLKTCQDENDQKKKKKK